MLDPVKPFKVVCLVGTRPEIIKLSRTLCLLEEQDGITLVLVHSGQNYDYELNQIFFEDLGLRQPDHFLNAAGNSAIETIANVMCTLEPILREEAPDAFLLLGDTNSCMGVVTAKKLKIPIFHLEAGNRCFDQRVPEEVNRRVIDHLSDINLCYSSLARQNLMSENLATDRCITVGSPMREIFIHYMPAIKQSLVLERLGLEREKYFLVSTHREENVDTDDRLSLWVNILNDLAKRYSFPVIVSTHPRTRKRIEALKLEFHALIRLLKPLNFTDYNRLQLDAYCTLSDSGTISEDSNILDFPALNLRDAHERPEAMEEGAVMMVGLNQDRILQALEVVRMVKRDPKADRSLALVKDYATQSFSLKVMRILISYTDYVNRTVWSK